MGADRLTSDEECALCQRGWMLEHSTRQSPEACWPSWRGLRSMQLHISWSSPHGRHNQQTESNEHR